MKFKVGDVVRLVSNSTMHDEVHFEEKWKNLRAVVIDAASNPDVAGWYKEGHNVALQPLEARPDTGDLACFVFPVKDLDYDVPISEGDVQAAIESIKRAAREQE